MTVGISSKLKTWLPVPLLQLGKQIARKDDKSLIQQYLERGKIPWSPGYEPYKTDFIAKVLANQTYWQQWQQGELLPTGYGAALDERCVEYPWLFANLPESSTRILDAGSVLNSDYLIAQINLVKRTLDIVTLAPENRCFWQKGISYLYCNLRELPLRDNWYDTVVCLSTLEHVGFDNTLYASDSKAERAPFDCLVAIREMHRVLKPGGCLFLSVPFGQYQRFNSFQQFDQCLLKQVVEEFSPESYKSWFYSYSQNGWQITTADDCTDAQYVDWITQLSMPELPRKLPVEPDKAAAARAVACIKLVKKPSGSFS